MNKKEIETSLVSPVTTEFVERRIYLIRGQKVMLDSDLAELYQVETKALNRAVQRNAKRFPDDFLLKLSLGEATALKYQFGTSNKGRGGKRKLPYVFTELGVSMLSSVLRSDRAVQMNIYIMCAFIKLRELLATHKELVKKMEVFDETLNVQEKDITNITIALNKLLQEKRKLPSAIGFEAD